MYNFFNQFLIDPISSLAQAAAAPSNFGVIILVIITLVLLGGITFYFIEHKKKTIRYHAPSDDGQRHDDVI
jgi:hypothetical protein